VIDSVLEGRATNLDFGNQLLLGSIVGEKWIDDNSKGTREDVESGLAGVTIELVDVAGNVVRTTTTIDNDPNTGFDDTGAYSFPDVPVALYTVREVVPVGYVQTAPLPGFVHTVNVLAEVVHQDIDFGNVLAAEIHGTKWVDFDGDGERDPLEPGWAGITIYLDNNNNGVLDAGDETTVTMDDDGTTPFIDEEGQYWFTGLHPNRSYFVREDDLSPAVQTFPADEHAFELAPGEVRQKIDFGNEPIGEASGTKWDDLDGNGQRDLKNEPGMQGVTIYANVKGKVPVMRSFKRRFWHFGQPMGRKVGV
jgi:hypothetical protein